jgi:GTP-binding protein Era
MIFVDTPGIVDPAYLLHRAMVHAVEQTIGDADVVVLILDGTRGPPRFSDEVRASLSSLGARLLPVVNKTDVGDWLVAAFGVAPLRVSAESGAGVEKLRREIAARLPASPFLYPEDELSSQSVRFFVAELIRETVFELYGQEVPYSTAVRIEEYREAESPVFIRASVLVERPSQKAILIGKGGSAIRELGTRARAKVEEFVCAPVYLDLWIKVLPRWRKDPVELRRLGFALPEEER